MLFLELLCCQQPRHGYSYSVKFSASDNVRWGELVPSLWAQVFDRTGNQQATNTSPDYWDVMMVMR